MAVRSTARRLGFSDWRKADSEDLCRWLKASTPPSGEKYRAVVEIPAIYCVAGFG
jgi:hypothetical protein